MGRVNLGDIKPGMKLEKDALERSGRVLLRAGTTTTTGSKLSYVSAHSEAQFSHSICPTCYEKVVKPELESFQQLLKERLNPACTTS